MTDQMKEAAKQIKENNDVVVRRADKFSLFVLLNKNDYFNKLRADGAL